jgi:hypothetical protein
MEESLNLRKFQIIVKLLKMEDIIIGKELL